MRKLATIKRIDAIRPIAGADAIECAVVGGWTAVIKRGEYTVGNLIVYVEIDAWIPHDLAPFLSKGKEPREFNGIKGERLRTMKLRGQLSQGLILPLEVCIEKFHESKFDEGQELSEFFFPGNDVSELLGIVKYEAPIPAQLSGEVKGAFPGWIPKTDQERIQNLTVELAEWQTRDLTWEKTEKLDGSSMTVYLMDGEFGVCSRNLELKPNPNNTLWKVVIREQLEEKLRAADRNLALQGELIGEGIQGNPYKIKGQDFFLFDIYDIDAGEYLDPLARSDFAVGHAIKHVPVITGSFVITHTVEELLASAEGKSLLNDKTEQEGFVYKCVEENISFKCISNKFLLKGGE